MMPSKEPIEPFVVNEENFAQAVNNAGPLARRRLFRKMGKVNFRAAEWKAFTKPKYVESPINGNRIDVTQGMVSRTPLPPADLEAYVTRFVQYFYQRAKRVG